MRQIGNTTAYRESLRQKILEAAIPLFKKNGVRAVKMDDIANVLGISKRTLYELYNDKEDLLVECIKFESDMRTKKITEYAETQENEMNIITYALKLRLDDLTATNAQFFTDLHKYSKIVALVQENKEKQRENTSKFIKRCIEHGYFRDDLNYDIVDCMSDAAMDYVMQNKIYQKYSWKEIIYTFMVLHMRGCCTEEGYKFLHDIVEEFINNENSKNF
ncbi:MAG: TetR/AcrR family transcriptional regulator [Prevotella sp.]|nr:TetR/AcrR family transcriptional regulator [Prevotella sp.]